MDSRLTLDVDYKYNRLVFRQIKAVSELYLELPSEVNKSAGL